MSEIASRKCFECSSVFESKRKKLEEYIPNGKINPALQKEKIHGRVSVPHQNKDVSSMARMAMI